MDLLTELAFAKLSLDDSRISMLRSEYEIIKKHKLSASILNGRNYIPVDITSIISSERDLLEAKSDEEFYTAATKYKKKLSDVYDGTADKLFYLKHNIKHTSARIKLLTYIPIYSYFTFSNSIFENIIKGKDYINDEISEGMGLISIKYSLFAIDIAELKINILSAYDDILHANAGDVTLIKNITILLFVLFTIQLKCKDKNIFLKNKNNIYELLKQKFYYSINSVEKATRLSHKQITLIADFITEHIILINNIIETYFPLELFSTLEDDRTDL